MDKKLLDILVCPLCKGPLIYDKDAGELICLPDRLAYPIRDEIPVMMEEEARELAPDEDVKRFFASSFRPATAPHACPASRCVCSRARPCCNTCTSERSRAARRKWCSRSSSFVSAWWRWASARSCA